MFFTPGSPPAYDREEEFARERANMVESQIASRGIRDERVLAAMRSVPRERFLPPRLRAQAFEDGPLPIGEGQTISQPFTVAFMANAARLTAKDRVLEIGAGCGYGAAILGQLAARVITIDRLPALAQAARDTLAELGYANIEVVVGDGTAGWPDGAPYDAIVCTAGGAGIPLPLVDQLAEGGRLVIPLGSNRNDQVMWVFTKLGGQLEMENLGGFRFVPLIGKFGWEGE